ncbi:LemA family protein [Pelagibacterium montanilacus]|uniref:LemA family protein n=1 Tax=Pelagibacterium montanilacus TaxID=2185280 RepID=UPI000F8E471C|nr:LemA family protein [Pelagibacterium montanilacus]
MAEVMVLVVVLAVAAATLFVLTYNGLTAAQTRVVQGWSGIEVQLKRRHDLVPSLVTAVRSAMGHEDAMLAIVTESRERAMGALADGDTGEIARQEAELTGALHKLIAYSESFPEIKATGNIETFQRQVEETEDQIAAARRLYNGNVQDLNRRILGIPGNLIAPMAGIGTARSFELDPAEARAVYAVPDVDLEGARGAAARISHGDRS